MTKMGSKPESKRDEKGRLLPGSNNNPKGRPRALSEDVKKALDVLSMEAVAVIQRTLRSDDEKLALAAAQEILNRSLGKPTVQLDIKADSPAVAHLTAVTQLMMLTGVPSPIDVTPPDRTEIIDVTPIEDTQIEYKNPA